MGRYQRNFPAITEAEQEKLKNSSVFVAGCGGLGGYILEFLIRIGVGNITACDGDVFAPSNLNRQLLSTVPLLGVSKAKAAAMRAAEINPEVRVNAKECFITHENVSELISEHDLVIDALDNGNARHILAALAPEQNAFSPSFSQRLRPAARRMWAVGLMKRKMATVLRISSSVS